MLQDDSISFLKNIQFKYPQINFIATTIHIDKLFLDDLIIAGFKGCIQKHNIYEQIIPAVARIMEGRLYFKDRLKLRSSGSSNNIIPEEGDNE